MDDASRYSKAVVVQSLLMDLQVEMRHRNLWSLAPPADDAFHSEQPFAADTMSFPQWLQFVLIARLQYLIDEQQELPAKCGVAPYAEVVWQNESSAMQEMLRLLIALDQALSAAS